MTSENYKAKVTAPNNKTLYVNLQNNGKGVLEGSFAYKEPGKHTIEVNGLRKEIHIGKTDYKENESMISSDFKIIEHLKSIDQNNKNLSIFWYKNGLPEVIKIYNTNYFYGKNWVGVLRKKNC